MKRGQGMPLNVIIIAVIVIIVLVVLVAIFTGQLGGFQKSLAECKGQCVPESQCAAIAPEGDCEQKPGTFHGWSYKAPEKTVCCLILK